MSVVPDDGPLPGVRYRHVRPVPEAHLVEWDLGRLPGVVDPDQRRDFARPHLRLHPELVAWLDANAPGWSFRSDWDHGNSGDDDETCHLSVPDREAGIAFIAVASARSRAWTAADRERMPVRVHLDEGAGEVEIGRAHAPELLTGPLEAEIRRRLRTGEHRTSHAAEREVVATARRLTDAGGGEEAVRVPVGDREATLRVEVVAIPPAEGRVS